MASYCNPLPRMRVSTAMKYRTSIAKWILLVLALMAMLMTMSRPLLGYGFLACGLFIAFGILHAADRLIQWARLPAGNSGDPPQGSRAAGAERSNPVLPPLPPDARS